MESELSRFIVARRHCEEKENRKPSSPADKSTMKELISNVEAGAYPGYNDNHLSRWFLRNTGIHFNGR